MRTVTHREMRNSSGEILRAVAAGETVQVTNGGQVAAVISPPGLSPLEQLDCQRLGSRSHGPERCPAEHQADHVGSDEPRDPRGHPRPVVIYVDTSAAIKTIVDEPESTRTDRRTH